MTGIFYVLLRQNGGGTDPEIRVSTESRPWRRKFSRRSDRDLNPGPFSLESGALTTELSPSPGIFCLGVKLWQFTSLCWHHSFSLSSSIYLQNHASTCPMSEPSVLCLPSSPMSNVHPMLQKIKASLTSHHSFVRFHFWGVRFLPEVLGKNKL